jgi:hypothetical protein
MTRRTLLGIASAAAFSVSMAQAAEPVRQIGIYVQPYYEAAREPGGTPRVAVGRSFDGLASFCAAKGQNAKGSIRANVVRSSPACRHGFCWACRPWLPAQNRS